MSPFQGEDADSKIGDLEATSSSFSLKLKCKSSPAKHPVSRPRGPRRSPELVLLQHGRSVSPNGKNTLDAVKILL